MHIQLPSLYSPDDAMIGRNTLIVCVNQQGSLKGESELYIQVKKNLN